MPWYEQAGDSETGPIVTAVDPPLHANVTRIARGEHPDAVLPPEY